jgi:hypothetical protein
MFAVLVIVIVTVFVFDTGGSLRKSIMGVLHIPTPEPFAPTQETMLGTNLMGDCKPVHFISTLEITTAAAFSVPAMFNPKSLAPIGTVIVPDTPEVVAVMLTTSP